MDIMQREASSCSLSQLTTKLIPEVIGREIEKSCQGIYPLQNVRILTNTILHVAMLTEKSGARPQSQVVEVAEVRSRCSTELARRRING